MASDKIEPSPRKILVAGGSGFIGSRLIKKLNADIHYHEPQSRTEILCLTRDPESIKDMFDEDIRLVKADVSNYEDLSRVMSEQIDVAYYLVHSMEGTSKQWKKFSERDRVAAINFAKVASEYGVKRIIYLGGLIHTKHDYDDKLSEHMRSRREVGEILQQHSSSKVTIFQAAVILGQGGGSFQMLQYLVERLPVMICPRWVLTKCQPIAVDDVVEYLARCIEVKETEGKTFDIGGPDVLTYLDMMRKYAKILNKSVQVIIIPFLTPRLSSYWVDLVTPVRASLARPLIDSLKHDATVQDDSIRQVIPIQLKSFEEAIQTARNEKAQIKQPNRHVKERSTQKINSKLLMLSLLAMAAIGSTYYIIDGRPEIYNTNWIILGTLWYLGIAFAIYFLRYGARLGALTAGLLGWLTLTFWLIDNFYIVWETPIIASSPDATITIRNFIGAGVAVIVIATSHNLFHKLR
ncbi:MAG: NAD-dependent epimerase/dehydratase family protein [Thermoproteota archaeon]|nr:NAD-dependent epimerase/dehydratase family protein [Thermoproteota archaeon]